MQANLGFMEWGPHLSFGADSSTEMRISWESDQYLFEVEFRYGLTSNCELSINQEYIEPTRHHCIVLKELQPDTQYYYKIFSGSPYRDDKVHSFRTGPRLMSKNNNFNANCVFDFCVLGDIHANGYTHTNFKQGFQTAKSHIPNNRFFLTVGDSIDDGNREIDWQHFFEITNPFIHKIPIMNTTGNHDTGNRMKYARFIRTWDHPYVDKRNGGYYSFRYANAIFIMMDSDNGGRIGTVFSDEQMDWLQNELEKAKQEDLWIFICFHRQMYSTGEFSMEPIMHQFYRPIFDEYHVDCVLYGHDHNYQSFWLDRDSSWGGTKYFVCGAAGGQEKMEVQIMGDNNGKTVHVWPGRTYSYQRDGLLPMAKGAGMNEKMHRMDDICKSQLFAVMEPNVVHFNINNNLCTVRCIGWQDQIFHEFSFKKTIK